MSRVLPAMPDQIEGFHPYAKLEYVMDVHAPKLDELQEHIEQIKIDGVKGAWVKIAEGEDPRSKRDKRTAKRTYDGAVAICELLEEHDLAWGSYIYYTDGHDGARKHWDADDEHEHGVFQYKRLMQHMWETRRSRPRLKLMGDAEDGRTPMEAAQRAAWLMWILVATRADIGHGVGVYLGAHWAKKHLLEELDPIADHYLASLFGVWQPHYNGKESKRGWSSHRTTEQLAMGPGSMVPGWEYRAAWQFGSNYLEEFDISVVDWNRVTIPACMWVD